MIPTCANCATPESIEHRTRLADDARSRAGSARASALEAVLEVVYGLPARMVAVGRGRSFACRDERRRRGWRCGSRAAAPDEQRGDDERSHARVIACGGGAI